MRTDPWLRPAVLGLCLSWSASGLAQQPGRVATIVAAEGAPEIDGRLDDRVWQQAEVVDGFVQVSPTEGAPPSEPTEVRLLIHGNHLYVAARMFDSRPDDIRRLLARRDTYFNADYFQLDVDGYHDRRSGQRFRVYASGVQLDSLLFNDTSDDPSWNAVWQSAVAADAAGWTAELAIPLSQLRFGEENGRWGLQLLRFVTRANETSAWQRITFGQNYWVSRFGELDLRERPRAPVALELTPYVAAGGRMAPVTDRSDPFQRPSEALFNAGADLRYRWGTGWSVYGTVNPDFGQVEADPAQVNLNDDQLFLSEKRPFFLEALDLFQVQLDQGGRGRSLIPFYSRRVGAAPVVDLSGEEGIRYAQGLPNQTPIYGALKLSGRTAGGLSLGVFDAVTGPVDQRYLLEGLDGEQRGRVQPPTHYLVARGSQQLWGGPSKVGVWATNVNRGLRDGPADVFTRNAYAGGADFDVRFGEGKYYLSGVLFGSHVEGDPAVITRLQKGFSRYAHRPDAPHLEVDETRRALSGLASELRFGNVGSNFTYQLQAGFTSPYFETNDLGFQNRADDVMLEGWMRWQDRTPGKLLQRWDFTVDAGMRSNFAGDLLSPFATFSYNLMTLPFWPIELSFVAELPGLDDRLTRGGPLAMNVLDVGLNGYVGTDVRKPVRFGMWGTAGGSVAGREDWVLGFNLQAAPVPSVALMLEPNFYLMKSEAQYVTAFDDRTATETYGRRYVFSDIDSVQSSITARADWIFSPRLSLQTYGRASLITGDYHAYKAFARPRTRSFVPLRDAAGHPLDDVGETIAFPAPLDPGTTIDDPDFVYTALQGNAVLRWEYLPGSTLFLVYQLDCDRHGRGGTGQYDLRAFGRLCGDRAPRSTVMAKLTYWWS